MKLRSQVHILKPSWESRVGQEQGWEITTPLQGPSSTIQGLGQEPKWGLRPQGATGRAPATSVGLIFNWEGLHQPVALWLKCFIKVWSSSSEQNTSPDSRAFLALGCTPGQGEHPAGEGLQALSLLSPLFLASEYNSSKLLWGNSHSDFIRSGRPFYFLSVFSTQRTGALVNFISVLSVF